MTPLATSSVQKHLSSSLLLIFFWVCLLKSDAVKISDVRFIDASGTSRGYAAPISLMCSENVPCTELTLRDIKITPAKRLGETSARCINAQGSSTGEVVPQVPCLS